MYIVFALHESLLFGFPFVTHSFSGSFSYSIFVLFWFLISWWVVTEGVPLLFPLPSPPLFSSCYSPTNHPKCHNLNRSLVFTPFPLHVWRNILKRLEGTLPREFLTCQKPWFSRHLNIKQTLFWILNNNSIDKL